MPELPEVETVRIGLSALLPGKKVYEVEFDWPKGFPNAPADVDMFLKGATIRDVRRRAKVLIIDLSTEYSLIIHLKMTGQLVFVGYEISPTADRSAASSSRRRGSSARAITASDSIPDWIPNPVGDDNAIKPEIRFGAGHPNDSLVNALPDKSTRVTLTFTNGSHLFFNDQRKFGWMKLLPTAHVFDEPFFVKLGPEPLEPTFTWQVLRSRLQRRKNTNIKAALLDQSVVAGVGNIYADESLWGAKLYPSTLVKDLTDKDFKTVHKELLFVLKLSIEKGGSSNHTYVNAEGKKGSYMNFARVFRRDKQPCPRCGTIIIKTRVAGRGTHLCPSCQQM